MGARISTMSTDQVAPAERIGFWSDWIDRLFCGLQSDLYGDTEFDGRMSTVHAGDIVLTRLESNRHRVMRSPSLVRASEVGYLKIVAPWVGCAGVEQKRPRGVGHTRPVEHLRTLQMPMRWANPVRVEHLIVMVPKQRLVERGLALDPLMARRLGGSGGVARLALETIALGLPRTTRHVETGGARRRRRDHAVRSTCRCSTWPATAPRDATRGLREGIKQHVTEHIGDAGLTVDSIALGTELQSTQPLQRIRRRTRRRCRLRAAAPPRSLRRTFDDRANDHRSITEIALGFGFSSMAHFSRVFRAQVGRRAERLPASRGRRRGLSPGRRGEARGVHSPRSWSAISAECSRMLRVEIALQRRSWPRVADHVAVEQGRPLAGHRQRPLCRRAVALVGQVGEAGRRRRRSRGRERRAPLRRSAAPGAPPGRP
jgi:AraC-like DNA-binding protein